MVTGGVTRDESVRWLPAGARGGSSWESWPKVGEKRGGNLKCFQNKVKTPFLFCRKK